MKLPLSLCAAVAVLCACGTGRPIQSKQDIADGLAGASIPNADQHKGALLQAMQSAGVPGTSFTISGDSGGSATISIDPVTAAFSVAGKGVLWDVELDGFSQDGAHHLDGDITALASFDYVPTSDEGAYGDLKLGIVGEIKVSGEVEDEMNANVTLITRFHDLAYRDKSVELFLNGTVTADGQTYTFANEDLSVLWSHQGTCSCSSGG